MSSAYPHVRSSVLRYASKYGAQIWLIIGIAVSVCCVASSPPAEIWQWGVLSVHLALMSVMMINPLVFRLAEIVLYCILIPVVYFDANYVLYFGVWLSVGLIAYTYAFKFSFWVLVSACLAFLCNEISYDWNVSDPNALAAVAMISINCIVYCIGMSFRLYDDSKEVLEERYRQKLKDNELDNRERSLLLSRRLHDSVSSDLSSALLLLADRDHDRELKDYRDVLLQIEELCGQALENVRTVIASTGGYRDLGVSVDDNYSFEKSIGEMIGSRSSDLASKGFHGDVDFNFNVVRECSSEVMGECLSLLDEIFTNIERYGDSTESYDLIVDVDECFTVVQNNCVRRSSNGVSLGLGMGLRLHAECIGMLNGELRYAREDGAWMLYARIPLTSCGRRAIPGEADMV
ncbi:hypothetical protein JS528_06380 [Bifidobacterium sp. MA2]|uniref:Histidine kinase n=1 Tax=Bifidobacterium santillanense TaxID=2809028 RepID=A0ABS5UPX6_9BIFI|nr:hypothetical protein [Bifidobacterium santillanense]MBT1172987.1 hypothetical protein [Bifidobacterium santillanense]